MQPKLHLYRSEVIVGEICLWQLLSQAGAWNALNVLNWWYLIAYLWMDFFWPLKINNYTLPSFQSSYFPFLLQRVSACLERHWSGAVWKLVQLIQQHADLWLNLPSRSSLQFICLHLHRGGMNHMEKGAIPLLTLNSHPSLLLKLRTYSQTQ